MRLREKHGSSEGLGQEIGKETEKEGELGKEIFLDAHCVTSSREV